MSNVVDLSKYRKKKVENEDILSKEQKESLLFSLFHSREEVSEEEIECLFEWARTTLLDFSLLSLILDTKISCRYDVEQNAVFFWNIEE